MHPLTRKQNVLFKLNVWPREDYLRLRLKWTEEVGREKILTLLSMKTISCLNLSDWSFFRRTSGLMKLKEKTVDFFERIDHKEQNLQRKLRDRLPKH